MSLSRSTANPRGPIPLAIIGGFLGSGKTSLLTHLLSADHGIRVAVLINDFGEINIDAKLVVEVEGQSTISLANGCEGYLPPPEQFPLGGYTTWRARTSCLEVQAEPKITAAALELLANVAARTRPS